MNRSVLPALLGAALLLGTVARAQDTVPPAPAPVPATPPVAPAPPVSPQPVPDPVTPPPAEPAPATPAPVAPKPVQPATPKPKGGLAPASVGLQVTLDAPLPLAVDGVKKYPNFNLTFDLDATRTAALRARGTITQSLDDDLRKFFARIPAKATDAHFEEFAEGWALVQRNGYTVDVEATRANVLAALKDPSAKRARVVFQTIMPKRTLDFFLKQGITAHLADGETNYYGSSAARVTNIHVGASHFQDVLLSGKEVSFNRMVGPIETSTGFVTGLVISGERTANGVGGGICQVSSTVFRALYNAGLPVVERRNHSYQVHYYDPQGLDATIYQPSQDLRFTNDTGGALWFQTEWDDKAANLRVSVFGKPRDFTVQVEKPRTLSSTPAPADRLIPDASVPAGQRRQVDWAAPGATIEVTRNFLRDGKVFRSDTLRSVYRPWPNIFLVGAKR
ncbi:VanW family protein [Deinococcus maricopensis]|uniref:VanW family protein n=1 Tax=Deinococcus maricopensis TaxID=309887 RepID=UPI0011D1C73C|nr:VanW family protein [Deinococcus maricopensis]